MWLGIDFGTCYSNGFCYPKAALQFNGTLKPIEKMVKNGLSLSSRTTLSLARGNVLNLKGDLGTPESYYLGGGWISPEEIVVKILRTIKSEAEKIVGEPGEAAITNAIITVPATYKTYKCQLMQQLAGTIGFTQVKLLTEPLAAAIYYSQHNPIEEGEILLLYDLGANTFDATLIRQHNLGFLILGKPKQLHDAGDAFDRLIFQALQQEFQNRARPGLIEIGNGDRVSIGLSKDQLLPKNALDICCDIKHQLSNNPEIFINIPLDASQLLLSRSVEKIVADKLFEPYYFTREALNKIIAPLIDKSLEICDQLVQSAGLEWQQVNQVLLVGGSCRIPYVQEAIRNKFGRSPVLVDELELAVCLGAAIYGANCQTIEKQPIKSCSDQLETIPQSPLLTRAEEDIELSSARDIDYSHLRDLLAARQWQKADEETTKVMLAAAEREEEGYLEAKHIANFPYQDLRTIDRLWAKYSAGRFGFSVQKRIWEKVGGSQEFPTSGDRFLDLMDVAWEFEKTVGWVIREYGDWLGTKIIKDREYSLAAPEGHLPSDYQRLLRVRQYQGDEYGYFFSRIE